MLIRQILVRLQSDLETVHRTNGNRLVEFVESRAMWRKTNKICWDQENEWDFYGLYLPPLSIWPYMVW